MRLFLRLVALHVSPELGDERSEICGEVIVVEGMQAPFAEKRIFVRAPSHQVQ
jgi:hypothetical protein